MLPPLYPVFLSLFASFPHLPLRRSSGSWRCQWRGFLIFDLGTAAAFPAGLAPPPLVVLGFVTACGGVASTTGREWFLAGVVFGFAGFPGSMPLFYLPLAAALHVVISDSRRRALQGAALLLAGLATPTVPYVIALSLHVGQFTPIDSHGSIHVTRRSHPTIAPCR